MNRALEIAPDCKKFKMAKAECLALLGRMEVRFGKFLVSFLFDMQKHFLLEIPFLFLF